jgi:hypothetical protein
MNEQEKIRLLELLSDKEIFGLDEAEASELARLEKDFPEFVAVEIGDSLEFSAMAISLANLDTSEPLPAHLRAKIIADSEKYFASEEKQVEKQDFQPTFEFEPKRSSIFGWLGWAFAAAFLVVLSVNIWTTRVENTARIDNPPQTPTPSPELTAVQKRERILALADKVSADWNLPKPDEKAAFSGDIVWDNAKQEGYMRFRGLPVNDKNKETYQLWIFDENQDEKTPVDGGIFDVNAEGEVIVPINAKLKIKNPKMFAVTREKPGGVVVSDRRGLVAIAKV